MYIVSSVHSVLTHGVVLHALRCSATVVAVNCVCILGVDARIHSVRPGSVEDYHDGLHTPAPQGEVEHSGHHHFGRDELVHHGMWGFVGLDRHYDFVLNHCCHKIVNCSCKYTYKHFDQK